MLTVEQQREVSQTANYHLHLAEERVRELSDGQGDPPKVQDLLAHMLTLHSVELDGEQWERLRGVQLYYEGYIRSLLGGVRTRCDAYLGRDARGGVGHEELLVVE